MRTSLLIGFLMLCCISVACKRKDRNARLANKPVNTPSVQTDTESKPAEDSTKTNATKTESDDPKSDSTKKPAKDAPLGTLRIHFKFKGEPPKQEDKPIPAGCGVNSVPDESLIVNPENNGIQDVLVYAYVGRRGGAKPPPSKPANTVHELANTKCAFIPHVIVAQVGDTIRVTNPDPIGHNANFAFFNNKAQSAMVPINGEVDVKLTVSEPAVIPVACNIHPWMKAHLLVLDHPFAAKSDKDGALEINGLPVGEELIFRAWHEKLTFKEKIWIDEKETNWKANKFEIKIKEGENDLGTVEVNEGE